MLLLTFSHVSTLAQTPLQKLVSQVRRAVVIVTTYDQNGKVARQGSGFFIDSNRIATNLHVIDAASQIRIKTFNGDIVAVQTVVATDKQADLAILQIAVPCTDTANLQVTDISRAMDEQVVVVSTSKDTHWKVSTGPLAATWNFEHVRTRLHITASLAQGSNGAPVVNLKGYVIGIAVVADSKWR